MLAADGTIAELAQKAGEYERQAAHSPEPHATELRKTAKILRGWMAELLAAQLSDARA